MVLLQRRDKLYTVGAYKKAHMRLAGDEGLSDCSMVLIFGLTSLGEPTEVKACDMIQDMTSRHTRMAQAMVH